MKKRSLSYVINVNVCKNDRCVNFAVQDSPDYEVPSYYLGFPALHCNHCGSNALLLSDDDIHTLIKPKIDFYLTHVKGLCPYCYGNEQIRYGNTIQKTPRFLCKDCRSVYSKKLVSDKHKKKLLMLVELLFNGADFKQIITKLAVSYSHFYKLLTYLDLLCRKYSLFNEIHYLQKKQLQIATKSNVFVAKGAHLNSTYLWGITSAISESGYVLLNNLNCTVQNVSNLSLYDGSTAVKKVEDVLPLGLSCAKNKYEYFLQRKSFDQIQYHLQKFHYEKESIIEPVICAYLHFNELKQYYLTDETYHYLEHEIALRSAVITAYSDDIKNKKCMVAYLYDSPDLSPLQTVLSKHKVGWWDNDWYVMSDSANNVYRLLGLLTPTLNKLTHQEIISLPASFKGIDTFYQSFEHYFSAQRLAKLSPKNIQILLNIFTCFYNFCLSNRTDETTAKKVAICHKRLSFEELIEQLFAI